MVKFKRRVGLNATENVGTTTTIVVGNPRIRSEDDMMLGQQKYMHWGRILGYNIRLVHDWEIFSMKRREGQVVSCRFTRRLEKVTQLIDKVVDGLGKLNAEKRQFGQASL